MKNKINLFIVTFVFNLLFLILVEGTDNNNSYILDEIELGDLLEAGNVV